MAVNTGLFSAILVTFNQLVPSQFLVNKYNVVWYFAL